MFSVDLAVEGTFDLVDLTVKHGDFVCLQLRFQMQGEGLAVQRLAVLHDYEELQGLAGNDVVNGYAHAVLHVGKRQCRILYLGRCDLEAADIDDVVLTAREMQHAIGIEHAHVGGVNSIDH